MKIKDISVKDDIYYVTFSPSFISRLFGEKEKVKRYKHIGAFKDDYKSLAFRCEDGSFVEYNDPMTTILNMFINKF